MATMCNFALEGLNGEIMASWGLAGSVPGLCRSLQNEFTDVCDFPRKVDKEIALSSLYAISSPIETS